MLGEDGRESKKTMLDERMKKAGYKISIRRLDGLRRGQFGG